MSLVLKKTLPQGLYSSQSSGSIAKMDPMVRCSRSRRRILSWIPTALLATTALAQFPGTHTPPPAELKKGWDTMTPAQAKEILTFLATQCEGRGSGQPGFQKAADYVAAHFKAWGLKPMGDKGTYFQNVPFFQTHFIDEGSSIDVFATGKSIPAGKSFRLSGLNESLTVTNSLAVIRPKGDSVDLSDVNLTGKIAIVFADKPSNSLRFAVMRQSPAATLFVTPTVPDISYSAQVVRQGSAPSRRRNARGPSGNITPEAANQLLDGLTLVPDPSKTAQGATVEFSKGFVRLSANVFAKEIGVPNVVGLLEGSDPQLKNEYIGIGGHLDHLGKQGTVVYPGADDDGSGSTSVLSIVHAMSANPVKPKRSILFMTFCGEEMGLIGSSYLVAHPPVPLDKMVAELQMDMVARDSYGAQNGDQRRIDVEKDNVDTIRLVGSKRISTELDKTIQQVNQSIGFRFKYDAEDVYTRSDHYNFARNHIPIAFLFDGFTPDYHQPSDTVDKIDFLKLANSAKLYYLTAYAVANRTEPPKHDVGN